MTGGWTDSRAWCVRPERSATRRSRTEPSDVGARRGCPMPGRWTSAGTLGARHPDLHPAQTVPIEHRLVYVDARNLSRAITQVRRVRNPRRADCLWGDGQRCHRQSSHASGASTRPRKAQSRRIDDQAMIPQHCETHHALDDGPVARAGGRAAGSSATGRRPSAGRRRERHRAGPRGHHRDPPSA